VKIGRILWLVTAALVIASFIDIVDGHIPKMISSISLALGQGTSDKKIYNWTAYGFIVVALLGFAFRLLNFYNT
jgi:hypothetical protein